MSEKDFVPYQESLELKELGFNERCLMRIWWLNSVHNDTKTPFEPHITINRRDIDFEYSLPKKHPSTEFVALELQVPTFSQAFRWLWLKSKTHSYIDMNDESYRYNIDFGNGILGLQGFKSYEEAELACLIKLIEIVKEKQL